MKKIRKIPGGFTLIELIVSMVLLAALMTAVAVAFNASIKNYHDNLALSKNINTARAALMRITNDIRTAYGIASADDEDDPSTQCEIDVNGDAARMVDIRYRFEAGVPTGKLFLDQRDFSSGTWKSYVLCENVTSMTFNRAEVPGSPGMIRNVRITMTVTDDKGQLPTKLATAAVIRRNL